jgi:predicted RNA binding protein YcfA (HicA-like mRNA interferase family)
MEMKVGAIIKVIEADGWGLHSQKGSHRQFTHNIKSGRVTVPGKLSKDVSIGLERNILKQAGLL